MTDLKTLIYSSDRGSIARDGADISFTADLPREVSACTLFAQGDFSSCGYLVLEYSTMGWGRPPVHRECCVSAQGADGKTISLLAYDDLTADGRRYVACVSLPAGKTRGTYL